MTRGAHPHAGADPLIKHPGRYLDELAGAYLDSSYRAAGLMLDALKTQSAAEVGIPAIMNDAILSDMGRMNARCSACGVAPSSGHSRR